ncbi:MAG: universal stress protein [Candidatus Krumholzibacteriota bacterium]|nr:universal stress protein [Candidatus Krumholzibacteriota bacterium]
MPGVTKVLFPTDFSELANHALPYAIRMAKLFDAELVMLHAVTLYEHDPNDPEHRFPALGAYCDEVRRMAGEDLQVCIEQLGDHGIAVREEIVQGVSPHASILEFLRDEGDVGLVVMSTHGRSGLRHVLLGSVTENVIRYAPAPVLVVKQPEHEFLDPATGEVRIEKILFPIDFSEESYKPVPWVKAVAGMTGAEVIVFHAVDVEIPPVYYTSGITSILELDPQLNERVEGKMRDVLGAKFDEIRVRYVVEEGRAIDRIRAFAAAEKVDLVAMGQAGSHGIGDFLLGSTAARVIQRAVCPVLVV